MKFTSPLHRIKIIKSNNYISGLHPNLLLWGLRTGGSTSWGIMKWNVASWQKQNKNHLKWSSLMLGKMTALAFVLQVYKFLSKRNTFRMVTGVPARLWSTATAPHRVRRCRRTRGNRKIFVIWPPSPVCAFPTKLKVRIWGEEEKEGGRREGEGLSATPRIVAILHSRQQ